LGGPVRTFITALRLPFRGGFTNYGLQTQLELKLGAVGGRWHSKQIRLKMDNSNGL